MKVDSGLVTYRGSLSDFILFQLKVTDTFTDSRASIVIEYKPNPVHPINRTNNNNNKK